MGLAERECIVAEISTKTSTLTRAGTALTIAAVVLLAVPLLYLLYALVNGHVTLNSSDAVNSLFTVGIVLTAVAGVLALLGLALHGSGLRSSFATSTGSRSGLARGKGVQAGISAVLLIGSAAFLFTTLLPRASAVENLNNNIAPFALSLQANCQKPLNQAEADITTAYNDAVKYAKDDQTFAAKMTSDAGTIQTDATTLSTAQAQLSALKVPDSKYQALHDGCVKDVESEINLITSSSALPLPAVAVAVIHIQSLSVLSLLQDAAAVASGRITINAPDGSAQELAASVLQQVVSNNSDPTLTAEGNQLRDDINSTLKNNLAPFVPGPALTA